MKTILCYGDSNTYGYIPLSGGRYDRKTRWPGALEEFLNRGSENSYEIIEEGLCGRTSCRDDPFEDHLNGLVPLTAILRSHMPLDLVIILLGTNDLKSRFHAGAYDIAKGVQRLALTVRASGAGGGGGAPAALMVCPPPLAECEALTRDPVFSRGLEVSRELPRWFAAMAKECGALFFDAGRHIVSSKADGIHLDAEEHRKLAGALAEFIRGGFAENPRQ
jgi:lysophospholipase L1-like esterase